MEVQLAQLGNKGMFKDTSISKASNEFAYHNRSIRITAVGEESLLSVTNEKGPSQREVFIKTSTSAEPLREILSGAYIGHCVTPDYIILFVKRTVTIDEEEVEKDFIYRINDNRLEDDEFYVSEQLFTGDLGLSIEHPIETLFYYESEDVQKVYWIDGIHQTRVINIKKEDYVDDDNTAFDFVPVINNIPTVNITKEFNALGNFHSGTIQYFITYYNKFGAETAIVWSSSLYYISPENRAGAPDEFCSCSFNINISDLDDKFEYIRVYSAKRQSLDGPIEASIVKDISIKDRTSINIIDDGTNQASVDSNYLYFIGGDNIIPQTFAQKDDTLFLGNIKLNDVEVSDDLKDHIHTYWMDNYDDADHSVFRNSIVISFGYKNISEGDPKTFYPFNQQINTSSIDFKGFKKGETYRFAIQYQDYNGKWTQPIWIGDKECTLSPIYNNGTGRRKLNYTQIPTAEFTLEHIGRNPTHHALLHSEYVRLVKDYINYRILIADTNNSNRSVIAQGIVCPTMFNYDERIHNKPYAISSYIMRPRNGSSEYKHFYPVHEIWGNSGSMLPENISDASLIPYQSSCRVRCKALAINWGRGLMDIKLEFYLYKDPDTDPSSEVLIFAIGAHGGPSDIQKSIQKQMSSFKQTNYWNPVSPSDIRDMADSKVVSGWEKIGVEQWYDTGYRGSLYKKEYSLVTDDPIWNIYLWNVSGNDYKSNLSEMSSSYNNEYYIDESIVTFNSPDILDNFYSINNSDLKFRLVGISPITSSKSNFRINFDQDSQTDNRGTTIPLSSEYNVPNISTSSKTLIDEYIYSGVTKDITKKDEYNIFMWHKSGSIPGVTTSDNKKIDVIESKLFSTERFSLYTDYFNSFNDISITSPIVFNYDNIALEKITINNNSVNYYGNYSKLITPSGDGFIINRKGIDDNTPSSDIVKSTDPTNIGYNCPTHVVFSLKNDTYNKMALLPKLKSDYEYNDYTKYSFLWNDDSYGIRDNNEILNCYGIIEDSEEHPIDNYRTYIYNYMESRHPDVRDCIILFSANDPDSTANPVIHAIYRFYIDSQDIKGAIKIDNLGGKYLSILDSADYTHVKRTRNVRGQSVLIEYNIDEDGNLNDATLYEDQEYVRCQTINKSCDYPYLFIGELYRDIPYSILYGGVDENSIENINWIPASLISEIDHTINGNDSIDKMEGDTYYQRWDCVKTTPQSLNDINQVIDITSVMLESHTCLDGRYDRNRVNADILNINTDNFNLFNQAYDQKNNIFQYNILDDKFDLDTFSNQIVWSNQKSKVDDIDTWTNISQISSIYLDGLYGPINKVVNFNDTIVAFQDKAISSVRFNNQIQVSTEQGLPIEVVNSGKVTGYDYLSKVNGCHNKWSIVEGSGGLYFIDDFNKAFFKFSKDGLVNVSLNCGFSKWFRDFITGEQWTLDSAAFRGSADRANHDIYLIKNTPDGCLCYSEDTQSFTSFYPYKEAVSIFNFKNRTMFLDNKLKIYHMFEGDYLRDFSVEYNVNPEPLIDKTFTNIEYTADTRDGAILHRENPFKLLLASTEYQSGKVNLLNDSYPNGEKKFRIWRADIPRDSANKLDRLRNTWMRLKLIGNSNIDGVTTLHNLVVKYFK